MYNVRKERDGESVREDKTGLWKGFLRIFRGWGNGRGRSKGKCCDLFGTMGTNEWLRNYLPNWRFPNANNYSCVMFN